MYDVLTSTDKLQSAPAAPAAAAAGTSERGRTRRNGAETLLVDIFISSSSRRSFASLGGGAPSASQDHHQGRADPRGGDATAAAVPNLRAPI